MVDWKGFLPDFKGALKNFYEENLKTTLENKAAYYEALLKENVVFGQRTQKIAIALGIGIFLLLAIAYFWQGNTKYLALGVLTGYLLPHIYSLVQEQENITFRHSYDSEEE